MSCNPTYKRSEGLRGRRHLLRDKERNKNQERLKRLKSLWWMKPHQNSNTLTKQKCCKAFISTSSLLSVKNTDMSIIGDIKEAIKESGNLHTAEKDMSLVLRVQCCCGTFRVNIIFSRNRQKSLGCHSY